MLEFHQKLHFERGGLKGKEKQLFQVWFLFALIHAC